MKNYMHLFSNDDFFYVGALHSIHSYSNKLVQIFTRAHSFVIDLDRTWLNYVSQLGETFLTIKDGENSDSVH